MLTAAPLTVSAFLARVNELLETQVAWVEGEVADFRISEGRWVHFDLKDATALAHCFGLAFRLRTPLEDGMKVRVWGVPRVYPKYGKFSLVVEIVEPSGEGALRRALELLKSTLEREGLFAPERKRPLPRFPERLVLLTSPGAAAYHDFLKVLGSRRGGLDVLFLQVPVQGNGAAEAIARAIDWVSEHEPDREALILVRGGGSLEELRAFNDERVVRALARSRIPTVVGVGHERDVTLADLVADVRASTPSHAAELITLTRAEIDRAVRELATRLIRSLQERVQTTERSVLHHVLGLRETVRERVDRMEFLTRRMEGTAALFHHRLEGVAGALGNARRQLSLRMEERLSSTTKHVGALERLLADLHPRRVLARGYSMTRGPGGQVVRDAETLRAGDALTTHLARGTIRSITASTDAQGRI